MVEAGTVFAIFGILFTIFWIFIILASVAGFVFWIMMLIDAAQRDFPKPDDKTLWVLVVIFAGVIGAILYYFMVKKKSAQHKQ